MATLLNTLTTTPTISFTKNVFTGFNYLKDPRTDSDISRYPLSFGFANIEQMRDIGLVIDLYNPG